MVDYYATLKVSSKASSAEVKSAYRRLARKLHPDKNNGSEETARSFAAIAEAYEVLGNPKERAIYDRRLIEAQYNNGSNGDSVFASSNAHAKRWRQLVYEHRYNEIIDRMIAEERREAMALQKVIFPIVALFLSTLVVTIVKPQLFANLTVIGQIILVSLFIVGAIHMYGRLRDGIDRFAYSDDDLHDSILDDRDRAHKPYSRASVGLFLFGGLLLSFGVGLLIGNYVSIESITMPTMFTRTLSPEIVFYPPIFVFVVDLIHSLALGADG